MWHADCDLEIISTDRLGSTVVRKTAVDGKRFDDLAKLLAGPASRRSTVRSASGALGAMFGLLGLTESEAGKKKGKGKGKKKKKGCSGGRKCGKACCGKGQFCCDDARRVCCASGSECCNVGSGTGSCCAPPGRCGKPGVTTPHPPSAATGAAVVHQHGTGALLPQRDALAGHWHYHRRTLLSRGEVLFQHPRRRHLLPTRTHLLHERGTRDLLRPRQYLPRAVWLPADSLLHPRIPREWPVL